MQFMFAANSMDNVPTVDLSQSDNLKAFFDAGLRPWRLPGLENSNCELMNKELNIVLPENLAFHLKAEIVDISVLAENQLATIEISCPAKPGKDAANETRQICQDLQISTDGLDDFASGKRGIAWGGIKTINKQLFVQIRLQSVPSLSGFSAMLTATIAWNYPDATMKFLTGPIQPPPGYENVSMDEPPRDPNRKQVPEHDASYYQNLTTQIYNQRSSAAVPPTAVNSQTISNAPNSPTSPLAKTAAVAPPSPAPTFWLNPWFGLLALLIIIATVYVLRKK